MIIKEKDIKESEVIRQLIRKIDKIDENYVNAEIDVIFQKQPFLISLTLGYKLDLKEKELEETELEEIMKVIFLIWEYYKNYKQVGKIKISESQFDRIQQKNINMLKYFEGVQGENTKLDLVASDLDHLNSNALLAGILYQFNNKKPLINMNNLVKGQILIGMKCLVESFEEVIKGK